MDCLIDLDLVELERREERKKDRKGWVGRGDGYGRGEVVL